MRNWQWKTALPFMAMLVCSGLSMAQQNKTTCLCEVKYENHNFTEPEELTVCGLKGEIANEKSAPISQACLGIFTETEHIHDLESKMVCDIRRIIHLDPSHPRKSAAPSAPDSAAETMITAERRGDLRQTQK
jgi:hypothetical protein